MKKRLLTAAWLCICLVLTACTAKDPDNLFEVTTTAPASTVVATNGGVETTEPSEQSSIEPIDYEALEPVYQYGNMQKGGGFMRLGKDVLFTFLRDDIGNRLYTYDLNTGVIRLNCDDATCSHSNCRAGGISWGLEVYEGKVYVVSRYMQGTMNHLLTEISDTEKVPVTKGEVYCAFHYDGDLYFKADSSLAVQEEDSDEIRVLIDEYVGADAVIFDDYLYTRLVDGNFVRIDVTAAEPQQEVLLTNVWAITDGQHIYYVDMTTNLFCRCAMDGTGAEQLLDKPVLPASINFDEEYVYFRLNTGERYNKGEDCFDLYRFPKNDPTKAEMIATLPEPIFEVYTVPGAGKLFVSVYVQQSYGDSYDVYVMGTDGSNPTKLEIPEY